MDKRDVVAELFQVRDNVGGKQNGMVLLTGELVEQLQYLVPDNRV